MLYFVYGENSIKARAKAKALVAAMQKKRPDAAFFSVTSENWGEGILDELSGSQGLFERKYIVLLDGLCEKKDAKEVVLKQLSMCKESENAFVMLERTVDKKTLDTISKYAEKVEVFEQEKITPKEEFNMFALGDALGKRDKKSLWVLYQKALAQDIAPEEMHGILFWQLKSMLLAAQTASAIEPDLKPFVYTKANTYSKNYSFAELSLLSSKLVAVYHDSRRGIGEFATNLEKFILEI